MLIPIRLYDIRAGASPDDPGTVTIVTSRCTAAADALARELMRRRADGLFEQPPQFFVQARDATAEFDSAEAARAAGYELRTVLAPVEEPVPDAGEPDEGGEPEPVVEEGAP